MTERRDEEQDRPLSSEALTRDQWRGDGASPGEDREQDAAEREKKNEPNPLAGTMLPPD